MPAIATKTKTIKPSIKPKQAKARPAKEQPVVKPRASRKAALAALKKGTAKPKDVKPKKAVAPPQQEVQPVKRATRKVTTPPVAKAPKNSEVKQPKAASKKTSLKVRQPAGDVKPKVTRATSKAPNVKPKKAKSAPQVAATVQKRKAVPTVKSSTAKQSPKSKLAASKTTAAKTSKPKAETKTRVVVARAKDVKPIKALVVQKAASPQAKKTSVAKKRVIKAAPAPTAKATKKTAPALVEVGVVVKARRPRVPADFALQYGEKATKKRTVKDEPAVRRARRDAALRQKMRDIMEPGDELVARLRRAGVIGGEDDDVQSARRVIKSATKRRPRKWEARCGKCGNKSIFLTAAGLCARCGAIMVREG